MSSWANRYDPREDLPYREPEKHILNVGDYVYYMNNLWFIESIGWQRETPDVYCNDSNAFYVLVRYNMGVVKVSQYVTNKDFGSGVANDNPPLDKVEYCDAPVPSEQFKYSKNYLALLGK